MPAGPRRVHLGSILWRTGRKDAASCTPLLWPNFSGCWLCHGCILFSDHIDGGYLQPIVCIAFFLHLLLHGCCRSLEAGGARRVLGNTFLRICRRLASSILLWHCCRPLQTRTGGWPCRSDKLRNAATFVAHLLQLLTNLAQDGQNMYAKNLRHSCKRTDIQELVLKIHRKNNGFVIVTCAEMLETKSFPSLVFCLQFSPKFSWSKLVQPSARAVLRSCLQVLSARRSTQVSARCFEPQATQKASLGQHTTQHLHATLVPYSCHCCLHCLCATCNCHAPH